MCFPPNAASKSRPTLLGSDIVMQLDQCVSWPAEEAPRRGRRWRLSIRWGARSKAAFGSRDTQALFGIQQGSTYPNLRRESSDSG